MKNESPFAEHDSGDRAPIPLPPTYEILQEACEYSLEALIQMDRQGQVLYINRRAEQILDCSRSSLIGQNFWQTFPEFAGSTIDHECHRAIGQQTEVHFEQFYPSAGIVLEVRARTQPTGLLVYMRDVSVRKQAEAMLFQQDRLATLNSTISTVLRQGGGLAAILQHCVDEIALVLEDMALVRIWVLNPDQVLELRAIAGAIVAADLPPRIALGISIVGLIAQNQQSYWTNDAQNDLCLGAKDWMQQENLVAFAGYPLVVEENLVGVMVLLSHQSILEVTHSLLQWIANGVALAIDRSLARQELLSGRESLLFRLANQIRNSLDLEQILETTVQEVRQLLQIDRCLFLWYWSNSDTPPTHNSPPPDLPSNLPPHNLPPPSLPQPTVCITHEARLDDLSSLLGDCPSVQAQVLSDRILNLQPIQIEDATQVAEPELMDLMQHWGLTAQLMLPLETRSGCLGAIVCGHCQAARSWSDAEVELLQAVTDQLVIAIDQAELYAQSRAAALDAQTQAQQLSEALVNLRQTQAQLIQSEKMSSLGQLVAGIAHEINNPLSFVRGNLNHASHYFQDLLMLLDLYRRHYPQPQVEIQDCIEDLDVDFLTQDLTRLLVSMQGGADRICKIVISLRNFSRLDESEIKAVDLHEGIDSALLIVQSRLQAKGHPPIEIIRDYQPVPRVKCYASQMNQVFMNLLSNAIDTLEEKLDHYTAIAKPFSPQIRVRTEISPSDSPLLDTPDPSPTWVVVRIKDNGMGMSDTVLHRLFDPFFTTKPVGSGTGLGLSISHQIVVEKHKGRLNCISEPGEGTEFIVAIPFKPVRGGVMG
jgi:two-component system, NtrC family, sensor kinase